MIEFKLIKGKDAIVFIFEIKAFLVYFAHIKVFYYEFALDLDFEIFFFTTRFKLFVFITKTIFF